MAITCPKCGAGFDATLFQFGHGVRCDCGHWVELNRGHVLQANEGDQPPGTIPSPSPLSEASEEGGAAREGESP